MGAYRDDITVKAVVKALSDGATVKELAHKYGVAIPTIHSRLRKGGVRFKCRRIGLPMRKITQRYMDDGASIADLAREYGVCENTIKLRIIWGGGQIRSCTDAQLVSRGASVAAVSRGTGLTEAELVVVGTQFLPGSKLVTAYCSNPDCQCRVGVSAWQGVTRDQPFVVACEECSGEADHRRERAGMESAYRPGTAAAPSEPIAVADLFDGEEAA